MSAPTQPLAAASAALSRPLYAAGTFPKKTGFFGVSLRASIIGCICGAVCLVVGIAVGVLPALVLAAGCGAFLAPMVITVRGRSAYEGFRMRTQWWRRRLNGSTVYRSGPHSRVPGGRYRLPGILAATTLHTGIDRVGNDFAMIHRRRGDEYTVVLECWPSGDEALTSAETDLMTADWGAYLAGLGLTGDIKAAVVVIESIPATGQRLAREVAAMIAEHSRSEVASRVMAESAATFPAGRQQQLARLAITFAATTRERKTEPEEMAAELARRLPALYEDLRGAGVVAVPMPAAQVVATVLRSYNPAVESDLEELDVLGEAHGVDWEDAGPAAAVTAWDCYRHDGVRSITWEMACPPESVFPDSVLKPLLDPHDELERKRLAIIYRPFTAGDATKQVDREYKDALVAVSQGKAVKSAASELRVQATEQARSEQVRGAGLLRYSMLATVTVRAEKDLATAASIFESLGARSRIRWRRAYGEQDAAYAASLGCGVLLCDHSSMSAISSISRNA